MNATLKAHQSAQDGEKHTQNECKQVDGEEEEVEKKPDVKIYWLVPAGYTATMTTPSSLVFGGLEIDYYFAAFSHLQYSFG